MPPDPAATIHPPSVPPPDRPAGRDWRVARWLSILAHPFGTLTVLMATLAMRRGGWTAALAVTGAIWCATFVPLGLYVKWLVAQGRLSGVDASVRQERPRLFVLTGLLLIGLLLFALVAHATGDFLRHTLAVSTLVVCAALGNQYWLKLSLHMACASYVAAALLLEAPIAGWVMLPVALALGWARVRLGRHTWPEVGVGAALGVAVAVAFASGWPSAGWRS